MKDPVEQVAREMFEASMSVMQTDLGFRHNEHWDETPESNRQHWRYLARVAMNTLDAISPKRSVNVRTETDSVVWRIVPDTGTSPPNPGR